MGEIFIPVFKDITVKREGGRIMVVQNGTLLMSMPWRQAKNLSKALRIQAARAEEREKVNQVIADQALLIRKGFPLAITQNPAIFKEAGNEAAHNRELRRYCPGGIPSGVAFGYPTLKQFPPESKDETGGPNGH